MASSNKKQRPFKIDQTGKLPWTPERWRAAPESRVTLSRPPAGAGDLLKWIDFVLATPLYRIRPVVPNYTSEGFTHVIWNTWNLLDGVAHRKGWVDRPRRPEPDRVITGLSWQELEFSATAVNRELEDLRAYLLQKLPSPPAATVVTPSPPAGLEPPPSSSTAVPHGLRPKEWEKCRELLDAIVEMQGSPRSERITYKVVAQHLGTGVNPSTGSFKILFGLMKAAKLVVAGDRGLQPTLEGLKFARRPSR